MMKIDWKKMKLRVTPVNVVLGAGILLFALILLIEKPELVPVKATQVMAEGGSGAWYLPDDPDKKIEMVSKRADITPDFWPEDVKQLLRDDPGAEDLVLNYPYYSADWEALQDLSRYDNDPQMQWGFAKEVNEQERSRRLQIVEAAQSWLGTNEADESYLEILKLYNAQEALPRAYAVQPEDSWSVSFASTVAIQCGFTDIIPTECSCDRQIGLFQELGCWQEADDYMPLPGDFIYYHWNCSTEGDCTSLSDHLGIVVGTAGPFIKVIEGNKEEAVGYRVVMVGSQCIRGYGLPVY